MRTRSVVGVLAALLLVLLVPPPAFAAAAPTAEFEKTADWGSGWQARFTLTNGSATAINGWEVEFDLPAGTSVGSFWDASLTRDGNHHTFSDRGWNGTIAPGAQVTFGFLGSGSGAPQNCTFNGNPCTGGTPPDDGGLGAPGDPAVTARTDTSLSLSWTASAGEPTGYRVYEGTDVAATTSGTTATITGLQPCTTHTFTVKAYDAEGESAASTAVTGTTTGCDTGPLPRHFLTGYWHNFVNPAQELKLSQTPDQYDLIAVAFAEATGQTGEVGFGVDPELSTALGGYTDAQFKADVAALQADGKKVILSVGGQLGRVRVDSSAAATRFADSLYRLMNEYGFDGVDIDLENGVHATYMGQALHELHGKVGDDLIITMAPQTIDMQSQGREYFKLALNIKDILTVVHMQYYNSGSMLGCDQQVYAQGSVDFMTALACIQLRSELRADQVALGLPAGPGAAGGGVVPPSMVTDALDCLAKGTNCGSFQPTRTYPDIRGAMTWSINWDVTNGGGFARTVGSYLDTLS